ncbi:hypothetical protein MGG_17304 [Pyricularia oryzae 70-15]|uniref:Uncharacterized protein n=3 Tax=Pyricularia oryzae TaxID=318829 RepID=G4NBL9_PYRO7|nr:uncharacterized protein MGG_17304 [Pyricularia oryzae 70-15]EHA48124.1 hypothetical protein MGG_17304 [Pyricularia oryzae 70-15]ELQ37785.1 hypothetical protein OOU_Y34scaffold00577g4 [Pyricularia oryzae Y34]
MFLGIKNSFMQQTAVGRKTVAKVFTASWQNSGHISNTEWDKFGRRWVLVSLALIFGIGATGAMLQGGAGGAAL